MKRWNWIEALLLRTKLLKFHKMCRRGFRFAFREDSGCLMAASGRYVLGQYPFAESALHTKSTWVLLWNTSPCIMWAPTGEIEMLPEHVCLSRLFSSDLRSKISSIWWKQGSRRPGSSWYRKVKWMSAESCFLSRWRYQSPSHLIYLGSSPYTNPLSWVIVLLAAIMALSAARAQYLSPSVYSSLRTACSTFYDIS